MKFRTLALFVYLFTCVWNPLYSFADDCGPDPDECVVTDEKRKKGMNLQFLYSITQFLGEDQIIDTLDDPNDNSPPDNEDDGMACNREDGGDGNITTFSEEETDSGASIASTLENLFEAVDSYGDEVTATLPANSSNPDPTVISLSDLMSDRGMSIIVSSGNLNGEIAQTVQFGTFVAITIDINAVNSAAVSSGGAGNSSRELLVTIFHEFGHVALGIGDDPATEPDDLDNFATQMANAFEEKATENGDNPYEAHECPL